MVIDLILDRKGGVNSIIKSGKLYTTKEYNAKNFYNNVMEYYEAFREIVEPIANALDSGEEIDVKRELCRYVIEQNYNFIDICKYILDNKWL